MKISGVEQVSRRVEIDVNPLDALVSMKMHLCRVPRNAFIREGKIVTAEDTSYHGSCSMEYTTYEVSDKVFKIFEKITELEELLRN